MSELLDEFWIEVIHSNNSPPAGLCNEIFGEYMRATIRGKKDTQPAKPDSKETLAAILEDYPADALRDALEQARRERTERGRQRTERERAAQEKQEQAVQERKERAILLSELSVLKPLWRCRVPLSDAGKKLYIASDADLERMTLLDLRHGMDKLHADLAVEEQRIREEEIAVQARKKRERDASPIFDAVDLDAVEPRFRYREPAERNIVAAEAELCKYDKFTLNYLRLLLALKGRVQQGIDTDAIIILVLGATGAGKNTTLLLAADMLCCGLVECNIGGDRDALLSAYVKAGLARSFAVCNEVQDVWEGHLKVLPHLTRGSSFKLPYSRAESKVDTTAVFILTARTLPYGLLTDPALARRTVLVDLGRGAKGLDWMAVGSVKGWRQRNPDAADDIISRELERFQEGRTPTVRQIATELGFRMLSDRSQDMLQDFAGRLEQPSKHSMYGGEDWRVINRGARGKATRELWKEFDRLKPAIDELCEVVYPTGGDKRVFIRFPHLKIQEVPPSQVAGEQGLAAAP